MSDKVPHRFCIACRISKDKNELIRIAHSGNELCVDSKKNMPGRGIYVCKDEKCINALVRLKKYRNIDCGQLVLIQEALMREVER